MDWCGEQDPPRPHEYKHHTDSEAAQLPNEECADIGGSPGKGVRPQSDGRMHPHDSDPGSDPKPP